MSPNTMRRFGNGDFLFGIITAWIGGTLVMAGLLLLPDEPAWRVLSMLLLPVLFYGAVARNFAVVVASVYMSELFWGVGGGWVSLPGVNGRSLVLLFTMVAYCTFCLSSDRFHGADVRRRNVVLFYAILFPIGLICVSLAMGNPPAYVFSDTMRFGGLLAYFPIRAALIQRPSLIIGWLVGASGGLGLAFSLMASGSESIRVLLLNGWIVGCSSGELGIESFLQMERGFFPPLVLCFIGLFGVIFCFSASLTRFSKFAALCCSLCAASGFILNFARGPIAASVLVVLLILFLAAIGGRFLFVLGLLALVSLIGFAGYYITINYLAVAMTKWQMNETDFTSLVSDVRVEQTQAMLSHWMTSPIVGTGIGSVIPGYSRDDSGLAFEVQYPMVLYRLGLIGFIILMAPFVVVCLRVCRECYRLKFKFSTIESAGYAVFGFALIAHLLSGWFNPYFATAMTPFLMALLVALQGVVFNKYRDGLR